MKKLFTLGLAFISSARWRLPINLLLAVTVGYTAVEFGLMSTQPIEHPTRSSIPAAAIAPPEVTAEINVTAITEAYLFGRPKVAKTVTPPTHVPPPKTQLQLKLHGIYYSSKPQASFAIIATPQGESAYYQGGDSVPGGALVDKIYPQHVILLSDKRREALYLEGSETTAQHLENQVQSPSRSHASDAPLTPEQLLGQYQQQLQTHPERLMQLVQLAPVNQDGQFVGYRLRPGADPSLMAQFDLRAGDILTAVNGINLNSPLKGFDVMQQLAHAQRIDVQILRDNQPLSLSFKIEH